MNAGSISPKFSGEDDSEKHLVEARTVAKLDHPNIVPVHDVGRTDAGAVYVVTRYIEGKTLKQQIADGLPTAEEAARIMSQMGSILLTETASFIVTLNPRTFYWNANRESPLSLISAWQ